MITGITEIVEITTKQDMSRWTRAHSDTPGITWSVLPGPGGTMIIVEHQEDRCSPHAASAFAASAAHDNPHGIAEERLIREELSVIREELSASA